MIFTPILKASHRLLYGPMPPSTPEEEARGLVLVADGVGGFDLCATGIQYAVGWAGASLQVRVVRWGHGLGRWHRDLTNTANQAKHAAAMAEMVRTHRSRRPGRPVFLLGKSGGSAVVVRALEQLEPGAVERVVLLAPALSPTYDLTRALSAVAHEMTVFWSPLDVVILGAGTWLFGTADRVRAPGAGLVCFRNPPSAATASENGDCNPDGDGDGATLSTPPTAAYEKLRQVCWRPRMARRLYLGGHVGIDNPLFLCQYVVPLFDPDRASRPARSSSGGQSGRSA